MENFNEVNLSRRNFVKGALAAGGAVALAAAAPAVKPFEAFAATGDSVALDAMEIGAEYTVTANAYVPYSVHQQRLVGKDAYLTDYRNPMKLQGFPTNPQTDNATIVKKAEDTYWVTIPIKNEVFEWLEVGTLTGAVLKDAAMGKATYKGNADGERITSVTVEISSSVGTPVFNSPTEYAAYPIIASTKNWAISLSFDLTSVKEK